MYEQQRRIGDRLRQQRNLISAEQRAERDRIREQWRDHGTLPVLKPRWKQCYICEVQGLWAPQSQQRGYCEQCHLAKPEEEQEAA
jgi:hypothetical protein